MLICLAENQYMIEDDVEVLLQVYKQREINWKNYDAVFG